MEKFDILKEKIIRLRDSGIVTCELLPRENENIQNSLVEMISHIDIDRLERPAAEIASGLKEIDRDLAQRIIAEFLHEDMAYRAEIMDEKISSGLASDFVSLFSENAKFFSSDDEDFIKFQKREITAHIGGGITGSTFSSGVFVVDENSNGFLLVEDED